MRTAASRNVGQPGAPGCTVRMGLVRRNRKCGSSFFGAGKYASLHVAKALYIVTQYKHIIDDDVTYNDAHEYPVRERVRLYEGVPCGGHDSESPFIISHPKFVECRL